MPGVSGALDPTAAVSPGQQLQAAGIIWRYLPLR
jgi:hypothetical protein